MITIYTRTSNMLTVEYWKWRLKRLLGKYSGPDAVADSVVRGLKQLGIPHEFNPKTSNSDTVLVISGIHALREQIDAKSAGKIAHLIAGPCIVTSPVEHDRLLASKVIDRILVPSEWVAHFYASQLAEIAHRIRVWPAGVENAEPSGATGPAIIYDKIREEGALRDAVALLERMSIPVRTCTYGTFRRSEYLKALGSAPLVIYLSKSESQGIALQEAWARNVPTFVPYSGTWSSGEYSWSDPAINAPYLTSDAGGFYRNTDQLRELVDRVHAKPCSFAPKSYCDAHLSDLASAQILVQIIHEITR